MRTTTRDRAVAGKHSPSRRSDPAITAAPVRLPPHWTVYDRRHPGKLLAVLPARMFATPEEAKAYYLRGSIVTVTDVVVLPRVSR